MFKYFFLCLLSTIVYQGKLQDPHPKKDNSFPERNVEDSSWDSNFFLSTAFLFISGLPISVGQELGRRRVDGTAAWGWGMGGRPQREPPRPLTVLPHSSFCRVLAPQVEVRESTQALLHLHDRVVVKVCPVKAWSTDTLGEAGPIPFLT